MSLEVTLGIDIGGTNTKLGLVDRNGTCLVEASMPTLSEKPVEDFCDRIAQQTEKFKAQLTQTIDLKGVGIGAPNGNYYKGTIEQAPNLGWGEFVPIANLVAQKMGVPTTLTNDANAAAVGEMKYGVAKGMKNFVVVTLGTGLGSGIVVNGELLYGHDGFAGELGHTSVFPWSGRDLPTGRKGSLEAYVSAPGLKRTVFELLSTRLEPSPLRQYTFENLDATIITKAAQEGDPIALEAYDYTAKILGFKLSDVVALFSPEAIILFGGLAHAGDLILQPTKKYLEEFNLNIFKNKVKVLFSNLKGNNTAVLGASALAWQELDKKG